MTKHLRFLFVMLLAMIWSAGWAAVGDNFKLVTDAKDLKAGDKIIIGSKASNVVLGADNGSKKRLAVSATFSSDGVVAWQEGFDVITLEGSASAWYLHSEAGYLYSDKSKTGKATTNLLTNTTKSDTNIASIKVDKNGATTISFINVASDRGIYCNTSTPSSLIFGYYQHTFKNKKPSQIYKLVNSDDKTSTTLSFDTETNVFNVEKNSESLFVAPKAVVKDAAGIVVAGANITYESDAPTIASVDENGKVTFGSEFGTATITASYAGDATYKPAASSYTIKYSKIPTFMAWSESVVNVKLGETFTAPTLTFTAHGVNLEGKTIQYSSSDETVATIDQTNGEITLKDKAGSTTITATFVGDDTYDKVSAEYTLNVIDPNKTTFDFTDPSNFGYSSTGKIQLKEGDKLIKDGFVLVNVQEGQYTTRFDNKSLKIYSGTKTDPNNGIISLSAPTGLAIKEIVFTDNNSNSVDNFTFSTGELKSKTWTGLAKTLTMEVAKDQVFIKTMTVYTVKIVELDENSESNTIEAKTGVNVILKRSMVANEWNTICLPFDVTMDKAKAAFGDNVKIVELDTKAAVDANVLSFKASTGIVAATPYLIKPSAVSETGTYTFDGVDITETNDENAYVKNPIAFKGIFNMVDITKDVDNVGASYYAAFLGAGNKIYKAGTGMTKGFRAYFAIPKDAAASALRVVIDGTATSIKNIDSEVVESNAPVYNLQGQRVNGNNLTPGIYVKAGKKFVVK